MVVAWNVVVVVVWWWLLVAVVVRATRVVVSRLLLLLLLLVSRLQQPRLLPDVSRLLPPADVSPVRLPPADISRLLHAAAPQALQGDS